ncbi:MAG: hypothetical protein AMXMBFR26_25400 [Porticoccaceae bacterium]
MFELSTNIEALLRQMPAVSVTDWVVFALLAVFFGALWLRWNHRGQGFAHYAPTLLTTLGILGTFVGIVIGLLGFDVGDIDGSMGPLLEGLKTAFITSLVGMLLAIVFKAIDSAEILIRHVNTEQPRDVGPEQIYSEMRAQREAIEKLARAISGDEEATLVTQIQKFRTQAHDDASELTKLLNTQAQFQASLSRSASKQAERFDTFAADLWKKLDQFAEMLSKSATEQVINALKEVITDFNRNLTEQFGDNFKKLNEAVEKLVAWQEAYREQLAQMIDQYTQGVRAITQTEASVAHISEESKQIPVTMAELKTVLDTTQHQIGELERHLEAFRDMRDRAVEAVPQIQAQMDLMVRDVSTAVKDAGEQIMTASQVVNQAIVEGAKEFQDQVYRTNEGLVSASDDLAKNSERIREQLEGVVSEINGHVRNMLAEITDNSKAINNNLVNANKDLETNIKEVQLQVMDSINTVAKRLETAIEEVVQEQSKALRRAYDIFEGELSKAVGTTGDAVTKQLEAMDNATQQQLERVMNAMGGHLASIANRFTEDYGRLTREMARVVERARSADSRHGVDA